jgi:hypothetical protein
MERIVVGYVHGASARGGDAAHAGIEEGLARHGVDAEVRAIDWGRAYGVDARVADVDWIVKRRFRGARTARERRDIERIEQLVQDAGSGDRGTVRLGRPVLAERTLLRWLYGRVMTADTLATMVDVLSYLRRPDEITGYVSSALDRIASERDGRRVVAVGLSLGGIILVDALAGRFAPGAEAGPQAELLVTVGSQSPFLLACDALGELRRGGPRPLRPFLPWLNVWNPDDYLSYPAGPIFGDAARPRAALRDVVGRDANAFPAVHGRYWEDETTYAAIADMLRDLSAGRFARRR